MRNLEKGQHIFIAFQNGKAVLDSQLRLRMYTSLENADRWTPTVNKGKIEYVEYAPTLTPPNEWVSVDERLPGVSGNYICAVKDKNGSVWTIPAEWSLEMKMWIGAFGEIKNIVTHWMPLPKSPKEDE